MRVQITPCVSFANRVHILEQASSKRLSVLELRPHTKAEAIPFILLKGDKHACVVQLASRGASGDQHVSKYLYSTDHTVHMHIRTYTALDCMPQSTHSAAMHTALVTDLYSLLCPCAAQGAACVSDGMCLC